MQEESIEKERSDLVRSQVRVAAYNRVDIVRTQMAVPPRAIPSIVEAAKAYRMMMVHDYDAVDAQARCCFWTVASLCSE